MADKNENATVSKSKEDGSKSKERKADPVESLLSGASNDLEGLVSSLKDQISNSDWLQKNTAEKWSQENPELAKEFMEAMKKS